MKIWHLKKDVAVRTKTHPWIYNSEIQSSVKEIAPGELIELHDGKDHFVAYGYGNPKSQIAFRKLSANAKEKDVGTKDFFLRKISAAAKFRAEAGWSEHSHRLIYGEGDGLPGLILDYFVTDTSPIVVIQASTAGMETHLPVVVQALDQYMTGKSYRLLEASTSSSRKLEGMLPKERRVIKGESCGLEQQLIMLRSGLSVRTDFLNGQKTGFFLDQQWNAYLLITFAQHKILRGDSIKMLDICCYVGQWSAHVADLSRSNGFKVECHLVDASEKALDLARVNVEALGATVQTHCLDVLESLPDGEFDLVVCDPPAFVKKKADIEAGGKAYEKLVRESIRRVRPGGIFVVSSCSGLVDQELWQSILVSALGKAGRTVRWITEGGHGPDHPVRSEFREGRYLKCNIGVVEFP